MPLSGLPLPLAALAPLVPAADKLAYYSGVNSAALADFPLVGRTLVAQATQAALRAAGLGLDVLTGPLMNYGGKSFNGTTDYILGPLTGIADGKLGTLVIWVKFANAPTGNEYVMHSTGSQMEVLRNSLGHFKIVGENAASANILDQTITSPVLAANTLYCIQLAWDLLTGIFRAYVNDAAATVTNTALANDTIQYNVANYSIGATVSAGSFFAGDLYQVYFDPTTAQDFSSAAIRRKFSDPNNIPMALGSHGELPTGTPPILFLGYAEFQNWPRNRGNSSGVLAVNGTPAAVTTTLYGQAYPVDNVGRAAVRTTAVGNVGTGEDDLITYTIPANRLLAKDCGVRITAWGTTANNANAKTIKLYFGSQIILTNALTISVAGVWHIEALVYSTGPDTQDYVSKLVTTGTAGVALNDVEVGTATQDDGAAIIVKCSGEAVSNNDIVHEGLAVQPIGV